MKKVTMSDIVFSNDTFTFTIDTSSKDVVTKTCNVGDLEFTASYFGMLKCTLSNNEGTIFQTKNIEFLENGFAECSFYIKDCNLPWNKRKAYDLVVNEYPDEKEAKKIWNNLKYYVSDPIWNKSNNTWELRCRCGAIPQRGQVGYVRKAKPIGFIGDPLNSPVYANAIYYDQKILEVVDGDVFEETWLDKDEYEAVKEYNKPSSDRFAEIEKVLENWEKSWPSFETKYTQEGKEIEGVKKVTLHWKTTPKKDLIECPLCLDMEKVRKVIGYPTLKWKNKLICLKKLF